MKKGVEAFHLANADYLFESENLDVNEEVVNTAAADKVSKKPTDRVPQIGCHKRMSLDENHPTVHCITHLSVYIDCKIQVNMSRCAPVLSV